MGMHSELVSNSDFLCGDIANPIVGLDAVRDLRHRRAKSIEHGGGAPGSVFLQELSARKHKDD